MKPESKKTAAAGSRRGKNGDSSFDLSRLTEALNSAERAINRRKNSKKSQVDLSLLSSAIREVERDRRRKRRLRQRYHHRKRKATERLKLAGTMPEPMREIRRWFDEELDAMCRQIIAERKPVETKTEQVKTITEPVQTVTGPAICRLNTESTMWNDPSRV